MKRLLGAPNETVTLLLLFPALLGIAGLLINGWHSDRTRERHWHAAIPLLGSGLMFALVTALAYRAPFAVVFLLLGSGFLFAYYPAFWAIPTTMLGETAAAATFALLNSIGQLGGLAGNYTIGFLNDRTHSLLASFGLISLVYVVAGGLILSLKTRAALGATQSEA